MQKNSIFNARCARCDAKKYCFLSYGREINTLLAGLARLARLTRLAGLGCLNNLLRLAAFAACTTYAFAAMTACHFYKCDRAKFDEQTGELMICI